MTWENYDPKVRDALKDNPQIRDTIVNMRDKGHSKETTQRITGAPYEVVDSIFRLTERRRQRDRDPDGND